MELNSTRKLRIRNTLQQAGCVENKMSVKSNLT